MKIFNLSCLFFICYFIVLSCRPNNNSSKSSPNKNQKSSSSNPSRVLHGDYIIYNDSIYFNQKSDTAFSYKFIADTSKLFLLSKILVYQGNSLYQKIDANKSIYLKEFRLVDWNFDGFKDISVLNESGSGGRSYWIWLFNPKKCNYVYNEELSQIWGLEQDTISSYIVHHFRNGAAEENWDTLKFVNGKLEYVKGLYQQRYSDLKGNQWKKQTRHFNKNNKWVEVVDSLFENY